MHRAYEQEMLCISPSAPNKARPSAHSIDGWAKQPRHWWSRRAFVNNAAVGDLWPLRKGLLLGCLDHEIGPFLRESA
jgi:hypothetical protein